MDNAISTELRPDIWSAMKDQASMLVKSGFLPSSINSPEKAVAIMLKGRELGIPAMQAFAQISVIQGKPAAGAELMLALIYRGCPGAKVEYVSRTNEACEILATRPGMKPQTFKYTMDDAKAAGLAGKDNWKKFPRIMLSWRCVAEAARSVFPDCIMGMSHTPEELNPDITVDVEGRIEAIPVEKIEPPKTHKPELEMPFGNGGDEEAFTAMEHQMQYLDQAAKRARITDPVKFERLTAAMIGMPVNNLIVEAAKWASANKN